MEIEMTRATVADTDTAKALATEYPYADYRCYSLFKRDFASDYFARSVEQFMNDPDHVAFLAVAGGKPVGFVGASRSAWDSNHFGLEMGGIQFLLVSGAESERLRTADALLAAVTEAMRERGIRHLNIKVDTDDLKVVVAAEKQGFFLVDPLVTYVDVASRPPAPRPEKDPALVVTTCRKDQFDQFKPEELEPLASFMRKAYRVDRFHADPRLPAERSHEVYVEWFWNIFNGEWADGVHVIRKEGRIVGFLGLQFFKEIQDLYGVKIAGRGLSAVLPEARGGYSVLVEASNTQCPMPHEFGEFDTPIQNYPVINVWIRQGLYFLRCKYTLHRWLDE
jgi:RimJ/RimL family protein N-acetyltransferase